MGHRGENKDMTSIECDDQLLQYVYNIGHSVYFKCSIYIAKNGCKNNTQTFILQKKKQYSLSYPVYIFTKCIHLIKCT